MTEKAELDQMAYDYLSAAMTEEDAACIGNDAFTIDDPQVAKLAQICRSCPLRAECDQYARQANPSAGVWAGRLYPRSKHGNPLRGTKTTPNPSISSTEIQE